MNTQITARHFDATPSLKAFAKTKLAKLHRLYDGITEARVILTENGDPGRGKSAEIILHVYRQTLSATNQGATHEEAVETCTQALLRQLKRYKARLRDTNQDHHR